MSEEVKPLTKDQLMQTCVHGHLVWCCAFCKPDDASKAADARDATITDLQAKLVTAESERDRSKAIIEGYELDVAARDGMAEKLTLAEQELVLWHRGYESIKDRKVDLYSGPEMTQLTVGTALNFKAAIAARRATDALAALDKLNTPPATLQSHGGNEAVDGNEGNEGDEGKAT